jgi:pyruvate,water dikinase
VRIFGVRTPGLSPELVDFTLFGEQSAAPPYEPRPGDESPEHTRRIEATQEWIFSVTELPELREDQQRVAELRAGRPDLEAMDDEALVARGRDLLPMFRELYAQHIYISTASLLALGTVSFLCMALGDPSMAMKLVAGIGEVDSAAPSFALWELGRAANADERVRAAFDRGIEGLLERLHGTTFAERFAEFLEQFGSRGPNEWESRSPTWETRPEMALAAIDRMRLASDAGSPVAHRERLITERRAVTEELYGRLDPGTRDQMENTLRAAKMFLAARERTKTTIVKFIHELRVSWWTLGRRMAERGVFGRAESFGMLCDHEFDDFLGDPPAWRDVIAERERRFDELQSHVPPFVIVGEVPPLEAWEKQGAVSVAQSGEVLSGIPGCPGEAEGIARVVQSPLDPRGLQPGDVLVAPITDPSWTPLFVPASAVVVDVGAQLSHAVIVARELGIPCVVSVTDATRRIPDGARVRVDGTNGTVTVT